MPVSGMEKADAAEGLRERKRKETLQRISEAGLRLFVVNGYDATTLEAIAVAAGVSRRTIFYYFKSKEEILMAYQNGAGDMIRRAVLQEGIDQAPLDAVLKALLRLASQFDAKQLMIIDQLMRSTEQLRASKQAKYVLQEQALFEALCELWPQVNRRGGMRVVAMAAIGALRLSVEAWIESGGKQPLERHLRKAFADLKSEI